MKTTKKESRDEILIESDNCWENILNDEKKLFSILAAIFEHIWRDS
jgi:hypothetical protein